MMKPLIVAAVLMAVSLAAPAAAQSASSTTTAPAAVATTGSAIPAGSGKIVMYRGSSVVGAAVGCPIRYNGAELVELSRGKFAEWLVPAGSYTIGNKSGDVEVSVAAGETKYVRCGIKPGLLSGRSDLKLVDQATFAEHSKDFKRKEILQPAALSR